MEHVEFMLIIIMKCYIVRNLICICLSIFDPVCKNGKFNPLISLIFWISLVYLLWLTVL